MENKKINIVEREKRILTEAKTIEIRVEKEIERRRDEKKGYYIRISEKTKINQREID